MAEATGVDELYDVKTAFYIGSFQQCVSEAQRVRPRSSLQQQSRDIFLYRAYLALHQYGVVRDEVGAAAPPALRPLRLLADYLQEVRGQSEEDGGRRRQQVLEELERLQAADISTSCGGGDEEVALVKHSLALVGGTVWLHEGRPEEALRALHGSVDDHLECAALAVHAYLSMNRSDLAQKQLASMQQRDDDAPVTQLTHAWLNIALGGEKLQEAYYIFQELMDKASATPLLLNGQAVCYLGMCKYADAESVLQTALEREPDCPETLVNLIALCQRTGKSADAVSRYLSQLKHAHASHPYVRQLVTAEEQFTRLAAQYAAPVSS